MEEIKNLLRDLTLEKSETILRKLCCITKKQFMRDIYLKEGKVIMNKELNDEDKVEELKKHINGWVNILKK